MATNYRQIHARLISVIALLFAGAYLVSAQPSEVEFRRILREKANFSESDFAELDRGTSVIKLLAVNEKREIGVCGVMLLKNAGEITMAAFRESVSPRNNRSMLDGGDISKPPVVDDLKSLELDKRDLEDMRKCSVGDCGLKLSAAMITRLQTAVDWDSAESKARATEWFRREVFDYILDYSRRGNQALMTFNDKKTPTRLADEHRQLLDEALFINDFAPEFAKHLGNYPAFVLPGVDDSLTWSKITFGFKPTITVAHVSAYTHNDRGTPQYLMATKQIYGSHYLDSSLALSMLVNVSANGSLNTYLTFTNLSRSDSLTGPLGGVKRSLIGTEATQHVKDILKFAKVRLESTPAERQVSEIGPTDINLLGVIVDELGNPIVQAALLIVIGAILFAGFYIFRRLRS